MKLSIIIPVYNEEKTIGMVLGKLNTEKQAEIIVVDGGSTDQTIPITTRFPVTLLQTQKGRARQMNEGAAASTGEILLFLHSDCYLEHGSFEKIIECVAAGHVGGCLTQHILSPKFVYKPIALSGNVRAKLLKIFYGDQAIFVRRDIFFALNGFDNVDLFDDVLFSRKLRNTGKLVVLDKHVYTLPRRWEAQGIAKTTIINWLITAGFTLGVSLSLLKRIYKDIR